MITTITEEIYQSVLSPQGIHVHFQPIISISKRKMIGFESLLRSYYQDEFVSPESLFSYANERNSVIALDALCQTTALFRYRENSHNKLLFINIETTLLEYYLNNAVHVIDIINQLRIPRSKIVIEINEKRADSNNNLLALVSVYRNAGFLIALDDVGAGHSNLNRIVLACPDIVKIDRSVIMNIHQNYYKQEVLHAITDLCQKIGAVTIAEGVEEEAEVVTCVSCGVDWFQGFYFSKAVDPKQINKLEFHDHCHTISQKYQQMVLREMRSLSTLLEKRKQIFQDLLNQLTPETLSSSEEMLLKYIQDISEIECVYLLSENGMQITDTLFHPSSNFRNQNMFSPMKKGDYHISRPFYNYALHNKQKTYISDHYISLATGNFCQTISQYLCLSQDIKVIVCVDFVISRG